MHKDFQFSMKKERIANKSKIWYRMSGRKLQKT